MREPNLAAGVKVIYTFDVMYSGWECDDTAWVVEAPDGSRGLIMTNHGSSYEATGDTLRAKIAEYQKAIQNTEEALRLLDGGAPR